MRCKRESGLLLLLGIHLACGFAVADTADECKNPPFTGVAFVITPKDPATESITQNDIQGKQLCVVTFPTHGGPTTALATKADLGKWFLDLHLTRSVEIWSVYSSFWKHITAKLQYGSINEAVTIGTTRQCARRAELYLYPTVLVVIDIQGVAPQDRSSVLFYSYEAEYAPDPERVSRCEIDPTQEVSANNPIQFKVAMKNHRALEGKLHIEVRGGAAPRFFQIPLPDLYDKESLQLIEYEVQKSPKSTGITRNVLDNKDASAASLSTVTLTRKIVPWME